MKGPYTIEVKAAVGPLGEPRVAVEVTIEKVVDCLYRAWATNVDEVVGGVNSAREWIEEAEKMEKLASQWSSLV